MTTLHVFGATGYSPQAGLVADRSGNVYGTTTIGGTGACLAEAGCGTVFRVVPAAGGTAHSRYQTLYDFQGGVDGSFPRAPLALDNRGTIYGYDADGNFGTVFRLLPPQPGGQWKFEVLYVFPAEDQANLFDVYAPLLQQRGHLYGIASGGSKGCGQVGCGSVFRLDPGAAGQRWTKMTLFEFAGETESGLPQWIAGFDSDGALYVSTARDKGAVVRLTPPAPSGGDWNATVITTFRGGLDGRFPSALALAANGVLYGLADAGDKGGLVYQLTPPAAPGADWARSVIAYVKDHGSAPTSLAPGAAGTLIGAIEGDVDFFPGSLYQLTPPAAAGSPWAFTRLWNFDRGPDRNPLNAVLGRGGIFSVLNGGDSTNGSVVELTNSFSPNLR